MAQFKRVAIGFDENIYKELKRLAEKEEVSFSAFVHAMCRDYILERETQKATVYDKW